MESGLFTLSGVIIGATLSYLLTRSNQHEQWRRDNRKQEYRELLSALAEAFLLVYKYGHGSPGAPEKYQLMQTMRHNSFKVLHDRIFIAEELKSARIMGKWTNILDSMEPGRGDWSSEDHFTLLEAELVKMALNDPADFNWFLRLKKLADNNGLA